jgi:spermidine synthase
VIDWHEDRLLPTSDAILKDSRCELRQGDFFELAGTSLDVDVPDCKFDAVLLDIDHSPEHFLDARNRSFYAVDGLRSVRNQLKPGGCFALWSNDLVSEGFTALLSEVFGSATTHDIEFPNPYTGSVSVNSVYVAQTPQK